MKALQSTPHPRACSGHASSTCWPAVPQRPGAAQHQKRTLKASSFLGNRTDGLHASHAACSTRSGQRQECRAAAPLQQPMEQTYSKTAGKALGINLDPQNYGSFAEIGAGQEVARWFFR
jgi:hypothetical protein